MKIEITENEAEELYLNDFYTQGDTFDFKGEHFTYVKQIDRVEEHRWNFTNWYIFQRDDGRFFAHAYDYGNTESQENGYIYSVCELFEVEPYEIKETKYKKVK